MEYQCSPVSTGNPGVDRSGGHSVPTSVLQASLPSARRCAQMGAARSLQAEVRSGTVAPRGITLSRSAAVEAMWNRRLYGYVSDFCQVSRQSRHAGVVT